MYNLHTTLNQAKIKFTEEWGKEKSTSSCQIKERNKNTTNLTKKEKPSNLTHPSMFTRKPQI